MRKQRTSATTFLIIDPLKQGSFEITANKLQTNDEARRNEMKKAEALKVKLINCKQMTEVRRNEMKKAEES